MIDISDSLAFVVSLLAVVLLVFVVSKLPGGCSGDCRQGRDKCNCKGN